MQHIETVTVGAGGAASITFSAIPDTFTDLLVKLSSRNSGNEDQMRLLLNGSSSNFSSRTLFGLGSSVGSQTHGNNFNGWQIPSPFTANTFMNYELYIPNYRSSTAKSISIDGVTEQNATFSYQYLWAMLWNDTSPITSLTLGVANFSFAEYSSASLYGILAGSDGVTTVS